MDTHDLLMNPIALNVISKQNKDTNEARNEEITILSTKSYQLCTTMAIITICCCQYQCKLNTVHLYCINIQIYQNLLLSEKMNSPDCVVIIFVSGDAECYYKQIHRLANFEF